MKVFVTGASGFIGSEVVKELLNRGHQVVGLARSEASANKIKELGAEVLRGGLEDLGIIKQGASQADGVIHTAFIHDFNQYSKANEVDKAAINAIGEALKGTDKPFVVTSGILGLPKVEGIITEKSIAENSRRSSETEALTLAEEGINVSVVRLPPSVHDMEPKGFIPFIIGQARNNGVSAYFGDGQNRWTAVHRMDAAKAFCLAFEKAEKGSLYNVVAEEGITIKTIAEQIGKNLHLPVKSLSGDEAAQHFEWMIGFIGLDCPTTSVKTREMLKWEPTHIGLLDEMEQHYF